MRNAPCVMRKKQAGADFLFLTHYALRIADHRKLLNCNGIPTGFARRCAITDCSSSFFELVTRRASPWMEALTFSLRSLIAFWIVLAVSLSMPLLSFTFWRTVLW